MLPTPLLLVGVTPEDYEKYIIKSKLELRHEKKVPCDFISESTGVGNLRIYFFKSLVRLHKCCDEIRCFQVLFEKSWHSQFRKSYNFCPPPPSPKS